MSHFSLTTPLYYVNDIPHMGSAYTTLVADAISRSKRLQGYEVRLITGTDEHGQKIERTAISKGIDTQEYCDRTAASFAALWDQLNIQYDRFIRTTNPQHHTIVKEFFQRVWDQGDIYLDQQKGWYCVACEEFKEERELIEGGYCSIHTNLVAEWRDEENYFFKLSKYQPQLEEFYSQNPNFIQPESRRNEVINFVKQGLQDFSISRVNVAWGFPVPANDRHTIYVWFDALLGYITALLDPEEDGVDLNTAVSKWWPINLHLIGKDILRFHAVYWPAMLFSAKLPLPFQVFGHGFLTKNGQKMGKSLGNVIDPVELIQKYGSDALRYYFLKEIELGKDGDFNESRFVNIVNADLANDLGNLLNRTLGMVNKYCKEGISTLRVEDLPKDNALAAMGKHLSQKVFDAYNHYHFSQACEEIFQLVRMGNKYIDESAPWSLYKQGKQTEVEQILYAVLESVRLAAYLLSPVIPNISNAIYGQLGYTIDFNHRSIAENSLLKQHGEWGSLITNKNLSKPRPIFAKIEVNAQES